MNSYSVNFTGHCSQIRTAYKVCHVINHNLPHISYTKIAPMFKKLKFNAPDCYSKFADSNPIFPLILSNAQEKKLFGIFSFERNLIQKIQAIRDYRSSYSICTYNSDFIRLKSIISQLKYAKVGNCHEDANISGLIMRMNGYDNVYTANLKRGKYNLDHCVCIFNRDGSEFKGKLNRDTIVIDAWSGMCDFAGNMFKKYENTFANHFFIPEQGNFCFDNVHKLKLSDIELEELKRMHPEFLLKK